MIQNLREHSHLGLGIYRTESCPKKIHQKLDGKTALLHLLTNKVHFNSQSKLYKFPRKKFVGAASALSNVSPRTDKESYGGARIV